MSVLTLAACAHTHVFSPEWEYDSTGHWHAASCEHADERDGFASHADGGDADFFCDECGYDLTPPIPAFSSEAEILPVKGGAGGIVVIVHDDGLLPTGNMLDELYLNYGLVGDVAMQVNNISGNSSSLAGWQAIIAGGRWKVISHSATHTWWGTGEGSADRLYSEIVTSQTSLRGYFPGQRVLTFAYPGFSADVREHGASVVYSSALYELVGDTYIGARWYDESPESSTLVDSFDNWELMDGYFLTTGNIKNGYLTTRLDRAAAGSMQIISLHALTSDATAPEGGYYLPYADMETACGLIADYVLDGRVWNAHYEDAVMYLREAQCATVSVTGDESALAVTLTDTLDDSVYNYPLTVRFTVPESWNAVNMTVGSVSRYLEPRELDGEWVIEADIRPDGGVATFTPTEKHAHSYSDEWTSDTGYHWHAAECSLHESCAAAVKDKTAHADGDSDGGCDACGRALFYSAEVATESERVTLVTEGELRAAIGCDIVFTVAVDKDYELWIKSGAVAVGSPVEVGEKMHYTLKIAQISENTTVVLDTRLSDAYDYASVGTLPSSEITVTVYEKDGSYSTLDNGGRIYRITYKNGADTVLNSQDGSITIKKYAVITSLKGEDGRETTLTYSGVIYGASGDDVVSVIPSRDFLGLPKGFVATKKFEIWSSARVESSEMLYLYETDIKIDRATTGYAVSVCYNDGGTDKCTYGLYVDGTAIKLQDDRSYAYHSSAARTGEWFNLRYELYKDGRLRVVVNGETVYTDTVTVMSPQSFRIKIAMRDDSPDRNSTVSFKNTRFLKYTE